MEQEEIDAFINDQLAKGYIHPSTSDQTSGIFFISKKNEKKQMVQDYRYVNLKTLKNNYPLPLIPELIDKISNAKVFTKMDLQWDATISKFEKVMKGKWHLLVIKVSINYWSCSLAYAILQPCSRL